MKHSLLFLPDISGYTQFIKSTEIEHSQHVIAELLEVLIDANTLDLKLAEIEGDALFFYKENEIPSIEQLLAQIEVMFSAFYSHLKMLKNNRICPCNACATAPDLQLKIIVHSGEIHLQKIKNSIKPFGPSVIEAHRMMKNSVPSDNYVLISRPLMSHIHLSENYCTPLFCFETGSDTHDGSEIIYSYAMVETKNLKLFPHERPEKVEMNRPPDLVTEKEFTVSASQLLEIVTNYKYRKHWFIGVDDFEYDENEVTRLDTEHICIINGKKLNFKAITKEAKPNQLVYGEYTDSPPVVNEIHAFFIITPISDNKCLLRLEQYFTVKSPFKKLLFKLIIKKKIAQNTEQNLGKLDEVIKNQPELVLE